MSCAACRETMPEPGKLYRHTKSGRIYKVLMIATCEHDHEPVVVYTPPETPDRAWTRPVKEWFEDVAVKFLKNGQPMIWDARFTLVPG
jgi:hypothetical protein